ncbi:MAG: polysaccharide biosynthesis C-terminal domain-containing protein [Caldilineaceae bacterium]
MLRDSMITLGLRIVIFVLTLGTNAIVARSLGPTEKGSYDLIILIITLSSTMMICGFDVTNVYFGARDPQNLGVLLGNSLLAAFVFGVFAAGGLQLLTMVPGIKLYLQANAIEASTILHIGRFIPFMLGAIFLRELVRAKGNILGYNLIAVAQAASFLLATIVLFVGNNFAIGNIIGVWTASQILAFALSLVIVVSKLRYRIKVDLGYFRQTIQYGIRIHVGNVAQFLNYRFDIFLVGYFLTPTHVAYYALATVLAEKLWELPHAIRTILLHRISQSTDRRNAQKMTVQVTQITSAFIIIGCVGISIFAYPFFSLVFGNAYLPSVPSLIVLLPGIWLLGMSKLLVTYLTGTGSPSIGSYAAVISLVVTLVLDILLIPRMEIIGAALATSLSYFVSLIVIGKAFQAQTGYSLIRTVLPDFSSFVSLVKHRKLLETQHA